MKEEKVYTQQEVLQHINLFTYKEDKLVNERKELNKELQRIRKQKEYWLNLDLSQLKLL
jgi:hypothetical protein